MSKLTLPSPETPLGLSEYSKPLPGPAKHALLDLARELPFLMHLAVTMAEVECPASALAALGRFESALTRVQAKLTKAKESFQ